ncbi:MAG: hypothetical protein JRJ42_11320 [Deltaproteobacteria bacterium]|nr:hypothetical protein [Deltaproteobacteria bacterium]MBW2021210.1 hypothetical protein [Deltaproteobacteria bacterium]MBW2075719.1 hypothetical protein [Deltaproteobacteria bacterium]
MESVVMKGPLARRGPRECGIQANPAPLYLGQDQYANMVLLWGLSSHIRDLTSLTSTLPLRRFGQQPVF